MFQPSSISIHALREEGDHITSTVKYTAAQISIHALREEGDQGRLFSYRYNSRFLSTPSARRATAWTVTKDDKSYISIHALREEGDQPPLFVSLVFIVFLSTPSARRATVNSTVSLVTAQFLSTPSARRATRARSCACRCDTISIHALREEGDPDYFFAL